MVWVRMMDELAPVFAFWSPIQEDSGSHEFVDLEGRRATVDSAFLLADCCCRLIGDKVSPLQLHLQGLSDPLCTGERVWSEKKEANKTIATRVDTKDAKRHQE